MNQEQKIKLASYIAVISGLFIVVVGLLMLLNYIQLQMNDPLEASSLKALVERVAQEPQNEELKQEIRNLDLLARKAYFTSQWQINTGGYLLLFAGLLFIGSLRIYQSLTSKIEIEENKSADIRQRVLSQQWILVSGLIILILSLTAAYFTKNQVNLYTIQPANLSQDQPVEEEIEVIEISSEPETVVADSATEEIRDSVLSPAKTEVCKISRFSNPDRIKEKPQQFSRSPGERHRLSQKHSRRLGRYIGEKHQMENSFA
ncbi:MAG: hypothetical protein HC906_07245 [Bacteroidales bacterium]|nr:hypothetical protein [Bacteroidales bacterium]